MEIPECPICLQSYDEDDQIIPRVLPCGHSACEPCIRQLPHRFPNTISCPACTQLVRFPGSHGPSSLPKNIDLLRFISQTKPHSQSKNYNPAIETRSATPTNDRNSPPEFLPRLWTEDFYSTWKDWILPSEAVSIEVRVQRGEGFFSLCQGRTMNSSSSFSSSSPSYSYMCSSFNFDHDVSLLYITDSLCSNESGFSLSYTARVMEALYRLKEQERTELGFLVRACSKRRWVCRVYGFWMDLEDGSVFLVCERLAGDFMKKLGELNDGFFGIVEGGAEGNPNLKVDDVILGFANFGLRLCEALMGLHSEGVVCGCLAPSCFRFDDYGCFSIDLNDVLVTGRRVRKSIVSAGSSQRSSDSSKTDLGFADLLKIQAFASPELLMLLHGGGAAIDHDLEVLAGHGSDIWSLGCILVRLLVGSLIVDELFESFYCVLQKRTDKSCDEFLDMYIVWMEKVACLLGAFLDGRFQSLLQIICQCLDYEPESRPHVSDVWRCVRGLLIMPHVDILAGLDALIGLENAPHCLILGDLCLLPKEVENGSQKQNGHELQECADITDNLPGMDLVGSSGTDVTQLKREQIDKELVDGLHSGDLNSVTLLGHLDCITGLAVGGGFLFSSSFDRTVHVWSLQDFSHVQSLKGHEHKVMAVVVVDADKPLCISGDGGGDIFIWDIGISLGQEPLKKWREHNDWRYTGVHSLAVSGVDYLYSGSGDKSIKAWSLQDYTLVCTMNGHKSVVSSLTVCNGILYSGSWDGTVRLWLLSDHSPLAVLGDDTPGSFASVLSLSAGSHLLVSSHENGCVKMWKNDILLRSMQTHEGAIFATDMVGKWLFTGGWNKIVNVQELSEDEFQVDARMVGTISCDSVITALLYWQGKLFVGFSNKVIKVYSNGR